MQGGSVLRASCGGCGVVGDEQRGYVVGECEDWQCVCVCRGLPGDVKEVVGEGPRGRRGNGGGGGQ